MVEIVKGLFDIVLFIGSVSIAVFIVMVFFGALTTIVGFLFSDI